LLLIVSRRSLGLAVEAAVLLVAGSSEARILAPPPAVVFVQRQFSLVALHTILGEAPAE